MTLFRPILWLKYQQSYRYSPLDSCYRRWQILSIQLHHHSDDDLMNGLSQLPKSRVVKRISSSSKPSASKNKQSSASGSRVLSQPSSRSIPPPVTAAPSPPAVATIEVPLPPSNEANDIVKRYMINRSLQYYTDIERWEDKLGTLYRQHQEDMAEIGRMTDAKANRKGGGGWKPKTSHSGEEWDSARLSTAIGKFYEIFNYCMNIR